jgi:hypothetical protein
VVELKLDLKVDLQVELKVDLKLDPNILLLRTHTVEQGSKAIEYSPSVSWNFLPR